jgi:hypothetical protein
LTEKRITQKEKPTRKAKDKDIAKNGKQESKRIATKKTRTSLSPKNQLSINTPECLLKISEHDIRNSQS